MNLINVNENQNQKRVAAEIMELIHLSPTLSLSLSPTTKTTQNKFF